MPDSKKKIRLKLYAEAIIAFVLVIILILLLAYRLHQNAYNNYMERTLQTNQSLANLISGKIESTFESIRNNLDLAAKTARTKSLDRDTLMPVVKSLHNHFADKVIGVSRMDTMGYIVATWPDTQVIGQDISNQTHVIHSMKKHTPIISRPIKTVQGHEAIVIHEPVFLHDSVWMGSVSALISLDFIQRQMQENLANIGAKAFIIDSLGQFIYHTDFKSGQLIQRTYDVENSEILTELIQNLPKPTRGRGTFTVDTNRTYLVGLSPIRIDSNIWTLGIYTDSGRIDNQLADFRKELFFAFLALALTIAVAFGGIVYFSILKDRRTENLSRTEFIREKTELLNSTFDSLEMLIEYGNKNRPFQVICDSLREAGDLKFAAICNYDNTESSINFPAVSYKEQRDRKSFFELAETIPQRLSLKIDTSRPEYRTLEQGYAIRVSSMSQLSSLSEDMRNSVGKLLEILNVPDIYVLPLKLKDKLKGFLLIIDEKSMEAIRPKIQNYIELSEMTFQIAGDVSELQNQNVLYADILRSIDSGIYVINRDLRLIYFNKNLKKEFNLSDDDIGKKITELMPHIKKLGHEKTYREVFRTGRMVTSEETSYLSDIAKRFVRTSLIPIISASKGVEKVMTIIEDITKQKELAEELKDTLREVKKLASTDGLTELYNYRYFSEALPKMMNSAREANAPLCLVVLDLDNLKAYNDLGGHHYGDNLLRVVGHILTQHQSPGDIVARYGGDEFVVILKNTKLDIAKSRAELMRTSILAYPFRDEEYLAGGNVTASFGVAELTDDVEDSDDLMRRADRALYRAKAEGKNRVRVWEHKE